jgi:hypothetical protein
MTQERYDKMIACRHLLPPPGAQAVEELSEHMLLKEITIRELSSLLSSASEQIAEITTTLADTQTQLDDAKVEIEELHSILT